MPTARNTGHRLRAGTYTSTSITSTYAIESWTAQSDMSENGVAVVEWQAPYQMVPAQRAAIPIAVDGTASPQGYLRGVFGPFSYWTNGMLSYFLATYLASSVKSALASAMFYDDVDAAQYLNLTLYRPVPGEDMEPAVGGWKNIRIRFDFGVVTS